MIIIPNFGYTFLQIIHINHQYHLNQFRSGKHPALRRKCYAKSPSDFSNQNIFFNRSCQKLKPMMTKYKLRYRFRLVFISNILKVVNTAHCTLYTTQWTCTWTIYFNNLATSNILYLKSYYVLVYAEYICSKIFILNLKVKVCMWGPSWACIMAYRPRLK